MTIILKEISHWDEDFFKSFISYKNKLYQGEKYYIPETRDDIEIMLGPDRGFNLANKWWAIMAIENDQILGRIFCSTRIDEYKHHDFFPFGFFEANNFEVAKKLIQRVEEIALDENYSELRGPIQGNVFFSSRFLLKQKRRPFLSEPFHRRIYIEYMHDLGFKQNEFWVSVRYSFTARMKALFSVFLKPKPKFREKVKLEFRKYDPDQWERECKNFYDITMDSFSEMKDVEHVSYLEFKESLESKRFLIKPRNCVFVLSEGIPVAYMCIINDIGSELAQIYRTHSMMAKMIVLLKLKFGIGRVASLYLGKTSKAEHLPRVAISMAKRIAKHNLYFLFNDVIFGYMRLNSITLASSPDAHDVTSEYATFAKKIK